MKAIILAAGKGTRLQSEKMNLPKALREANNKPLISYVLDNIDFIDAEDTIIVVGYKKEMIIDALSYEKTGKRYVFATQDEQRGTAHAALCTQETLKSYAGPVMVLYCDMPLLTRETYLNMAEAHVSSSADCTLLAADLNPPPAFGRLIFDENNNLYDIIEDSSCDENQKKITMVNVGIQICNAPQFFEDLKSIPPDGPKQELYLTKLINILARRNRTIQVQTIYDEKQTWGVNSMEDLEQVERALKEI